MKLKFRHMHNVPITTFFNGTRLKGIETGYSLNNSLDWFACSYRIETNLVALVAVSASETSERPVVAVGVNIKTADLTATLDLICWEIQRGWWFVETFLITGNVTWAFSTKTQAEKNLIRFPQIVSVFRNRNLNQPHYEAIYQKRAQVIDQPFLKALRKQWGPEGRGPECFTAFEVLGTVN